MVLGEKLLAMKWVTENVGNVEESQRSALMILRKYGYDKKDIEYLEYGAQTGDPGDGDYMLFCAYEFLRYLKDTGLQKSKAQNGEDDIGNPRTSYFRHKNHLPL